MGSIKGKQAMAATPNTLVGASWPLAMPLVTTPPATATGFRHPEPTSPREFGEAMTRTRKQKGRKG